MDKSHPLKSVTCPENDGVAKEPATYEVSPETHLGGYPPSSAGSVAHKSIMRSVVRANCESEGRPLLQNFLKATEVVCLSTKNEEETVAIVYVDFLKVNMV